MQKENEYGRIIAYERKSAKLPVELLCEGICSSGYLQRIEKGIRSCEKILADIVLQRIGVAADKFSYILNVQEWDMIFLKEQIVDFVDRNRKEEAYQLLEHYKELTKGKSVLYMQFCMLAEAVLEWKNGGDTEQILKKVLDAWDITRKGKKIIRIRGQHLSYFEVSLAMLYVHLLEDRGAEKEAVEGYQELLVYLEKRIEEADRVKWYPQIAYRLIRLLKKERKLEQAIEISEKTIQLLQKQAFTFYLEELLENYIELLKEKFGKEPFREEEYEIEKSEVEKLEKEVEDMPQDIQKRISDINGICQALRWCYQEYQIKQVQWVWDISFGIGEIYLCQTIIRGRRIGLGMTQEKLAEGICDPVTISRIECGKSYPKRRVLVELLQKVRWSGEHCTLTAQIGNPEYHRVTSQISNLTYLGKHAEAEKLLEELEEKIQEKNVFAEQYFLSNLGAVQFALGKKDALELYALAEKALHFTVPALDRKKLEKWHFTRAEVMCINLMSYGCESVGKTEYVIELLKMIKEFYERQNVELRHYRAGYELTLRNLGNLLGNMKEYEEAILLSDLCIKMSFLSKRIGTAAVALYDKGWDMECLGEKGKVNKKESLSYMKASYYLNVFLDRKIQYEFIKKHIEKLYEENV